MVDEKTLAVYAAKAADYARLVARDRPGRHLSAFIAALPEGGRALDLGCGVGDATVHMVAAGLEVDAWDASPEMIAIAATKPGVSPELRRFEDLDANSVYDGIHANFSLLHASRADWPRHLAKISRALKPGGHFHLGTKLGEGEKRDALGRFYAYFSDAELTRMLAEAGMTILTRATGEEAGLAGTVDPYIIMLARKND